jgi:hypothetical protein
LIRECERLVLLDRRLPALLSGKKRPADTAERLTLARMCHEYKQLHAAAAQFYTEAFVEAPQLADDLREQHRYRAACAAARAGCGHGKDAGQSDDKHRVSLRHQALAWLQAEITAYRRLLDKEPDKAAGIREWFRDWQRDKDFDGVREAEALAKLPEAERADWQKLWGDVEAMVAAAQAKTVPAKKPNSK